jgi:hypothetical protein
MKFTVFILTFFSLAAIGQDTIILKTKPKMIVDILHTTSADVVYKKMNDKKERSYILSFAEVRYIYFRDNRRMNVDSMYTIEYQAALENSFADSTYHDSFGNVARKPNMEMYKLGERDAAKFYEYDDFLTSKITKRAGTDRRAPGGVLALVDLRPFSELEIEYPYMDRFGYADYRAGYIHKVKKKKQAFRLYTFGGACILLSTVVVFYATR